MPNDPDIKSKDRFTSLLEEWQKAEDDTITHCQKIFEATDNVLIKTMADIIRSDATRHKEVLGMIPQAKEGAISLMPEEMGAISELITEHLEIERHSISLAMEEFEHSRNFAERQLFFYLLEDEKKHFKLLTHLNDFQRKLYPFA